MLLTYSRVLAFCQPSWVCEMMVALTSGDQRVAVCETTRVSTGWKRHIQAFKSETRTHDRVK